MLVTELELALKKLEATKTLVAELRRKERLAEERRQAGLKLVKAKMRELKVTVSDLTDPAFA